MEEKRLIDSQLSCSLAGGCCRCCFSFREMVAGEPTAKPKNTRMHTTMIHYIGLELLNKKKLACNVYCPGDGRGFREKFRK